MQEMEYDINGTIYVQRPLVIGQVRQLAAVLKGVSFHPEMDVADLVEAMGDRLFTAVAIVLNEKGRPLKGRNIEALAAELEFIMTPELLLQAIDDFFVLNPISSILDRIGTLTEKSRNLITILTNVLMKYWLSSLAATSPTEMPSSGDLH
jgi:hypothetical protein